MNELLEIPGKPSDAKTNGRPDPSLLTTRQLEREVASVRELMEMRLDGVKQAAELVRDIIETRISGNDEAVRLLQDTANEFPGKIDEKITALEKVHEEKFNSISKQFDERDVRQLQDKESSTTAVNAALQAAKELSGKQADSFSEATKKSEDQFTKQIDLNAELFRAEVRGLVAQIDELKDRFNRGDGKVEGVREHRTDNHLVFGILIAATGLIISVAGIVIAVLLKG